MPKDPATRPISFRLRASLAKRLRDEGEMLGLSEHELARMHVVRSLENENAEELVSRVESLERNLMTVLERIETALIHTRRNQVQAFSNILIQLNPRISQESVQQLSDELFE